MNNKTLTSLVIAIVAFAGGYFLNGLIGGDKIQSEAQVNLQTDYDSLSYFIGLSLGYQTADLFPGVSPALLGSGLNTVLNDSSAYDQQTVQFMAMQLQQTIISKKAEEGVDFLKENAKREGVFTTVTGLQYEPIIEGDGPMPADTSNVTVHYHGTFIDGSVFDSSVERDEPSSFYLNRVIPGWTEGLQLMSVGSKYKFFIPSQLAYGERGNQAVPPNTTLIFEVELFSIN